MSQWNGFSEILALMEKDVAKAGGIGDALMVKGVLHALILSWATENDCLVWITSVPGENIFGSQVVFVNDKVLNKLQWSFEEWADGTGPLGVFNETDMKLISLSLAEKSRIPMLVRVRKKNTPPNQEGDKHILYIHHDLPYNLRLTLGIPD